MGIYTNFDGRSAENFNSPEDSASIFEPTTKRTYSHDSVLEPSTSFDSISEELSHITLRNGVKMPLIGLGTTHSGGYNHESVVYALKECGYRMIDTAKRYGLEKEIRKAIKESSIPRDDLFLNTKLWPLDFGPNVKIACEKSCQRLGIDYLDMYMIHLPVVPYSFPNPKQVKEETWRDLEKLYEKGTIKSIGVSNYTIEDLEEILEFCSIKPHVNQCEFHIFYNNDEIRKFCDDEKIQFMENVRSSGRSHTNLTTKCDRLLPSCSARKVGRKSVLGLQILMGKNIFPGYCPLAKGQILNEPEILRMAQKSGKTPAQICIRWSIQQGIPAIPKSRKIERVEENIQVFDFELSSQDMKFLTSLEKFRSKKVMNFDNIQEKMNLPDGYKLTMVKS